MYEIIVHVQYAQNQITEFYYVNSVSEELSLKKKNPNLNLTANVHACESSSNV